MGKIKSKRFKKLAAISNNKKVESIEEAIKMVKKNCTTKFDESSTDPVAPATATSLTNHRYETVTASMSASLTVTDATIGVSHGSLGVNVKLSMTGRLFSGSG